MNSEVQNPTNHSEFACKVNQAVLQRQFSIFLRTDKMNNNCTVVVTGKAVNRGDGEGMQVPCTLHFKGARRFIIDIISSQFQALVG